MPSSRSNAADRVRDLNIKIDMDMSKKNVKTEEYLSRHDQAADAPLALRRLRRSAVRHEVQDRNDDRLDGHWLQSRRSRRHRGPDGSGLQGPPEHAGEDDSALDSAERGDKQAEHRRGKLAHDPEGDRLGQYRRRMELEVRRQRPPQDAAPRRRRPRVHFDTGRRPQEGADAHPGRGRLQSGPRATR